MIIQDRFEALCEAYGGDIAKWPEAEREAAEAFLAAHPDTAMPALVAARALDEVLTEAAISAPSEGLHQSIVSQGVKVRQPRQPVWAAAAAAVMLTVGLSAGWMAAPGPVTETEEVYASAFGALDTVETLTLEEDA